MDEINTSLDNIVAQYNDSVTHSAPKKLFDTTNDFLNDSDPVLKKRRLSGKYKNASAKDTLNVSNDAANTSNVGMSPWQERCLRADFLEAKAKIGNLEKLLERERGLRKEIETLSECKVKSLIDQCSYSSNKIVELEEHMKCLRQREQLAKQEKLQAIAKLEEYMLDSEESLRKLEKEKQAIEQEAREIQNSMADDMKKQKLKLDKLCMELSLTNEELNITKGRMEEYKTRALACDDLKATFEKENQNWEFAKGRIKELEAEIATYNDWKNITKNTQTRLQSIPEMEKEMARLKAHNKNLHAVIGNKLLLEEQVHNYQSRLAKEEGASAELKSIKVKLALTEKELKEWESVAQDHCLPNTLVSPLALRSRIEQLLQQDIIMNAEKKSKISDTKSLQEIINDLQQKCDIYLKHFDEMNMTIKKHKNFKERLQRKLVMVSRERDFYKTLLDNFDKDLTISNATLADGQIDAQVRYRVEVLERTLAGYKEMCAQLEKDINELRVEPIIDEPVGEGYSDNKKEIDALRLENEKLKRRKDELERELENRCMMYGINMEKYKVLHMTENPAAEAYAKSKNMIEKLQAEIERLKRHNKKLEDDHEETLAKLNDNDNITMNFKENNQLRAELESALSKMKKLKECYKISAIEFRDVCYMLLGYRVDRINNMYRLSSMFAESPDDYLHFRLNEENNIELLESPYSVTIQTLIDSQLVAHKSIPVLLSNLTLELFNKATVTIT